MRSTATHDWKRVTKKFCVSVIIVSGTLLAFLNYLGKGVMKLKFCQENGFGVTVSGSKLLVFGLAVPGNDIFVNFGPEFGGFDSLWRGNVTCKLMAVDGIPVKAPAEVCESKVEWGSAIKLKTDRKGKVFQRVEPYATPPPPRFIVVLPLLAEKVVEYSIAWDFVFPELVAGQVSTFSNFVDKRATGEVRVSVPILPMERRPSRLSMFADKWGPAFAVPLVLSIVGLILLVK